LLPLFLIPVLGCVRSTRFFDFSTAAAYVCSQSRFTILCGALKSTGLKNLLTDDGAYTVFAPTNDAFELLGVSTLKNLLADVDSELSRVLLYHIADGVYADDRLQCNQELVSRNGEYSTTICNAAGKNQVGNGNLFGVWPVITEADTDTCNGVVHTVSNVIIPTPP